MTGLEIDSKNRLLVVDAGTGKLLRISSEANKLEVLVDSYDGYRFESVKGYCNRSKWRSFCQFPEFVQFIESVLTLVMGILNDDLVRVDGLAISPDGKQLIATEPDASRVVVYDIS